MTLPTRLLAAVLLPLVLAMSSGVEPGCGVPGGRQHPVTAHHGAPGSEAPAPHSGHDSCPSLPGVSCPGMTGCLSVASVPALADALLSLLHRAPPPQTSISALLPRDITPESPPPRA
jgi:hypothetical protein